MEVTMTPWWLLSFHHGITPRSASTGSLTVSIYTGRRSLGEVLVERVLRYVRTEFWW